MHLGLLTAHWRFFVCTLGACLSPHMGDGSVFELYIGDYRAVEMKAFQQDQKVWQLAVSPDGKAFATLCTGGLIRVTDIASGKEMLQVTDGKRRLCLVGLVDADTLVLKRWDDTKKPADNTLEVWDVPTQKLKRSMTLPSTAAYCQPILLGRGLVATGSVEKGKKGLDLWDVTTGKNVGHLPHETTPVLLSCTHDGKRLASATSTELYVWDVATRKPLLKLPLKKRPFGVALAPDGKTLYLAPAQHEWIRSYDVATGEWQYESTAICQADNCMACSSDGKVLATTGTGLLLLETTALKDVYARGGYDVGAINCLVALPKGNLLLTHAKAGEVVKLWRIEKVKER